MMVLKRLYVLLMAAWLCAGVVSAAPLQVQEQSKAVVAAEGLPDKHTQRIVTPTLAPVPVKSGKGRQPGYSLKNQGQGLMHPGKLKRPFPVLGTKLRVL